MRVGVLGAGRIGRFHAKTLADHPEVEEVAVSDVRPERAALVAEEMGGSHLPLEEIPRSGLDAAVIAAATAAHADLIDLCMRVDLPIFCEKPLAFTYEETVAVVERVESSGAVLQVGFQRRFDAGYREAKRLIDSGELGTLYSMRIVSHDPEPPPNAEEYIPASGGLFRDTHIHDFDVLRWLTGSEVEEVYARAAVRKHEVFARYGDFDNAVTMIRMVDGTMVMMTGGRHDPLGYDVRHEILGSDDSIAVGLDERTPLRSVEPGMVAPVDPYPNFLARFAEAYRAETRHFVDVACGRAENPCTVRDALEALRIAEAAQLSASAGRSVSPLEVG
jgi:myo-inositol 2-dehydrogenase/D-chiro-inositol 1-dehydrogenase